jgi:transcriptional regulator with XRE-family HTH domain
MAKTMGETLKAIRRSRGMTQQEVADRIGCHVMWISARERDAVEMRVADLHKLRDAMQLTPFELSMLGGWA